MGFGLRGCVVDFEFGCGENIFWNCLIIKGDFVVDFILMEILIKYWFWIVKIFL